MTATGGGAVRVTMDMANLRQLRLLFEDFPKNHNLVLLGRPSLLANLDLGVNHDIKSAS